MTYVEGFIVPVPRDKREAYRQHAAAAVPLFHEFGVRRHVEAWEDDVKDGQHTDFRRAVLAGEGEKVVFSWFEYPDKAAREAANARIMSDPRMHEIGQSMPFDGKRMVFGGFDVFVDLGKAGGRYVDGFVLAVPHGNREAYRSLANQAWQNFSKHGALRLVEAWGEDVPDGQVTDFRRSVAAEPGEAVVFSWLEWPSKQARDEAWPRIMQEEPSHSAAEAPFDGKRMFWGGFEIILDEVKD